MWPSQYQAVWAVGQGAPWEGKWEGWHVGLESPRPGQPWLCRVSSWPSGQVTKSLETSAFGTCDTGLRCGSNSAPQSVAKSMDLSVSTHLEVNRHVPSSQQVSKRPLVPSTCGNSLTSRADASGRRSCQVSQSANPCWALPPGSTTRTRTVRRAVGAGPEGRGHGSAGCCALGPPGAP